MVKVLFCGGFTGNDAWEKLLARLEELQKSAHGPFQVLFLCGSVQTNGQALSLPQHGFAELKMKIYHLFDIFAGVELEPWVSETFERVPNGNSGIFTAHSNLTVAYYRGTYSNDRSISSEVTLATSSMSYRGCDVLLSDCWPTEAYQLLSPQDLAEYRVAGIDMGGSRGCSDFACLVRPRYHFVGGNGFYQRTPYQNTPNASSSQPILYTRLISLASISESKDKRRKWIHAKDKRRKWIHALSLSPIISMKVNEIEDPPTDFTPCPYIPIGKRLLSSQAEKAEVLMPPAKRFQAISEAEATATLPSFFYSGQQQQQTQQQQLNLSAPSTHATTLFIGGLNVQSKEQDLHKIMKNIRQIRRQAGKRFAFVDFTDHISAMQVVEQGNSQRPYRLDGKVLSVGWAADNKSTDNHQQPLMTDEERLQQAINDRQLIPPSEDAKVLYIGNLPNIEQSELQAALSSLFPGLASVQLTNQGQAQGQQKWMFAFVEFDCYESAMNIITRSINEKITLQGHTLVIGWSKGGTGNNTRREPPSADCKVIFLGRLEENATVEEVKFAFAELQSVQSIRKPAGRDYAFIEFYDHISANQALEICLDGGFKIREKVVNNAGWAKGKAAENEDQSTDCWFCLASPSVKVHLIVSVGQYTYLALPRGGIVDHHIMICPIDCVPSRLHLSTDARQELLLFMRSWEKFCASKGEAVITYERAIRTTGSRDHMQVHCISIPYTQLTHVMKVFQEKIDVYNYHFHEIDNDQVTVEDFVVNAEGGPYQEYFYMELPFETADGIVLRRRMVYLHDGNAGGGSGTGMRFQMSLGSEILATVLGRPERAFWKNCVLDEASEEQLAERIRTEFAPYDHTLR